MQRYIVKGIVAGFGVGDVLILDADQVAKRAGRVEELDADVEADAEIYEAIGEFDKGLHAVRVAAPVQFKRGEVVGVVTAGSMNKARLAELADVDSEEGEEVAEEVAEDREAAAAKAREREEAAAKAAARRGSKGAADKNAAAEASAAATDAAKRLAEKHGIDLGEIEGTGKDGAITVDDVKARIPAPGTAETEKSGSEEAPGGSETAGTVEGDASKKRGLFSR